MADSETAPLLVTEKAAAKMIGVTVSMLVAARYRKQLLLPFVRVGKRAIRYHMRDINDFIEHNKERPHSTQIRGAGANAEHARFDERQHGNSPSQS
jgi:hypothetical protein